MNTYTLKMDTLLSYAGSTLTKDDVEVARIQFDLKDRLSGNLFVSSHSIQVIAEAPEKVSLLKRYIRSMSNTGRKNTCINFIENNNVIAQLLPNPRLTNHKIIFSGNEYLYKNGLISHKYIDSNKNTVFNLKEKMFRSGSVLEAEDNIDELLVCIFTYGFLLVARDSSGPPSI